MLGKIKMMPLLGARFDAVGHFKDLCLLTFFSKL